MTDRRSPDELLEFPCLFEFKAFGAAAGSELRAVGVDVDFAPVLDVDSNPANPVIGDRAFHRDARVATLLAKSLMHGLLQAGMANCGKHFPGHGWARADTHVASAIDDRPSTARTRCDPVGNRGKR